MPTWGWYTWFKIRNLRNKIKVLVLLKESKKWDELVIFNIVWLISVSRLLSNGTYYRTVPIIERYLLSNGAYYRTVPIIERTKLQSKCVSIQVG